MFQITPKDVIISNRRTLISANRSLNKKATPTTYKPTKNISNILNESGLLNRTAKSGG